MSLCVRFQENRERPNSQIILRGHVLIVAKGDARDSLSELAAVRKRGSRYRGLTRLLYICYKMHKRPHSLSIATTKPVICEANSSDYPATKCKH